MVRQNEVVATKSLRATVDLFTEKKSKGMSFCFHKKLSCNYSRQVFTDLNGKPETAHQCSR
jgi:hypothetical protein